MNLYLRIIEVFEIFIEACLKIKNAYQSQNLHNFDIVIRLAAADDVYPAGEADRRAEKSLSGGAG